MKLHAPDRAGHEDSCGIARAETPQSRSGEEAEAEPTESEVAGPVGGYAPLFILIDFVYSLKGRIGISDTSLFRWILTESLFEKRSFLQGDCYWNCDDQSDRILDKIAGN